MKPLLKFSLNLLASVAALVATQVKAGDLFILTANDNSLNNARATGSDLLNLVDNAINNQAEFSRLNSNDSLHADLTYSGLPNALSFDLSRPPALAGRWRGQLTGKGGLAKTFEAPTRQGVFDQMRDFLKNEGAAEYAKFLKAISASTKTSPSDGNPGSVTGTRSFQNFSEYSSTVSETREEKQSPKAAEGRVGFGVVGDVGTFRANGLSGTAYALPVSLKFRLSERVGLNFSLPLSYTTLEKAKIFGVGLNVGVPVKIIQARPDNPWSWQVTPFGGANVSGSKELLVGGLIMDGGLGSVLTYDFGAVALSFGSQISIYESMELEFNGIKVDPGVSQKIVKNGLKLDVPFKQRWIFDVYGIHTKYLEAAGVDQYFTFGAEIGYRMLGKPDAPKKKNGYIKVGAYADVGNGYTSQHVQFGAGWKF